MNDPANPNKALWEKGDFTRIADTMRESGETLVKKLGIKKGLKVLDLGCGDGAFANQRLAARYRKVDGESEYVALYELAAPAALEEPRYAEVGGWHDWHGDVRNWRRIFLERERPDELHQGGAS